MFVFLWLRRKKEGTRLVYTLRRVLLFFLHFFFFELHNFLHAKWHFFPPAVCPYNPTNWAKMLIRNDLSTVNLSCKHFVFNIRFGRMTDWVEMLSTAMFVREKESLLFMAVHPHFVYIIKFFVARQIVCSHSIPVRISDISLAENRKLTQKISESGLNCLCLRISKKCDSHRIGSDVPLPLFSHSLSF